MNYRHAYHAGNFADVLKHIALMLCLEHLKQKATPFRVIDTHAGAGRYRLDQAEAIATGEWREGIGRLLDLGSATDALSSAKPYLEAVRRENTGLPLSVYPGSPALVQSALRAHDKFVANELHPEDSERLAAALANDRRCKITCMDGYAALKALLPPPERRGLVLIDPPFEVPGELKRMTDAVAESLKRFATGIYLLWYPIKDPKPIIRFHRALGEVTEAARVAAPLKVELLLRPARNAEILNGAGLAIINPPFRLAETMKQLLPALLRTLGIHQTGSFSVAEIRSIPSDRSIRSSVVKPAVGVLPARRTTAPRGTPTRKRP